MTGAYETPAAYDALQENPAGPGPQEPTGDPGAELTARPSAYPIPALGLIVDLNDPGAVAATLRDVRRAIGMLSDARTSLTDVLVEESRTRGTKTMRFGETEAVVSGGSETWYDVEVLRELLDAGLPSDRWAALVTETVSYKVDARVVKQLAAANETYAEIVERATRVDPKPWRVSVK